MIGVIKSDRYSIVIELDNVGCSKMLQAYQQALKNQSVPVTTVLDRGIFSRKLGTVEVDLLVVQVIGEEMLDFIDNNLILSLNQDSIQYGVDRLSEGMTVGNIFPAELCNVLIKPKSNNVTIYCILNNKRSTMSTSFTESD